MVAILFRDTFRSVNRFLSLSRTLLVLCHLRIEALSGFIYALVFGGVSGILRDVLELLLGVLETDDWLN